MHMPCIYTRPSIYTMRMHLLQAADSDDARHVLLDSAELKVAPLLQAFLYDPQRLRDL